MIAPSKWLLASALAATVVNGHGYMSDPKVKFTATAGDPTQFIATIEASASGLSGTFNGSPKNNVAAFTKAFGSSKYKSLKEFINDKAKVTVNGATLTCGSCDPKEEAQPLPQSTVEWSHSASEGFTRSHEGPCEVWCDDVRTFQDDDCAAHYTTAPAKMPYDRDACMGSSVLTFYWMAMHSSTWQVYVNCAPLEKTTGTGAASKYAVGGSTSKSTTPSDTPSTSETPTVTSAPSSGSSTSQTPSAPSATSAPSTPSATSAPSTTTTDNSDCGSYDVAGSESDCGSYDVAGAESDCGSYDIAGANSDCGSYDVAGSESECGSYDVAGSESECGSYDVAGGSGDDAQTTSSQTSFDFNTVQGAANAGTVAPQNV